MQRCFDEIGPKVQKLKTGVRRSAGNMISVEVAFLRPSVKKNVARPCNISVQKEVHRKRST